MTTEYEQNMYSLYTSINTVHTFELCYRQYLFTILKAWPYRRYR